MTQSDNTTPTETPKKKKGRPFSKDIKPKIPEAAAKIKEKVDIDWDQFEKLCGFQCTTEEIADFFRVEEDQLIEHAVRKYKKTFAKIYRVFAAPGLCSLRRNQFILAKNNSQMAMWLGKVYLKQVDPAHTKVEETVDKLSSVLEQIDEETKRIIASKEDMNTSFF